MGLAAVSLAGCAGGGGGKGLPVGESCNSIRGKLNQLDAKGVPAHVEAQSRGKKLGGQAKADADAYNALLNQYLGARCHEPQKADAGHGLARGHALAGLSPSRPGVM